MSGPLTPSPLITCVANCGGPLITASVSGRVIPPCVCVPAHFIVQTPFEETADIFFGLMHVYIALLYHKFNYIIDTKRN